MFCFGGEKRQEGKKTAGKLCHIGSSVSSMVFSSAKKNDQLAANTFKPSLWPTMGTQLITPFCSTTVLADVLISLNNGMTVLLLLAPLILCLQ
jgi:hypothetical protein